MRLHGWRIRPGAYLALLAVSLVGCGKAPLVGKGSLRVSLTAAVNANNCGKSQGFPLTYRLLQVSDPSAMAGLTLKQVWDKEEKVLGSALLKKTEGFVDPGHESALPVQREDGATAMIVVGNFCQTRGNSWYVVQPLSRGGSVKLIAEATGFRVTP